MYSLKVPMNQVFKETNKLNQDKNLISFANLAHPLLPF